MGYGVVSGAEAAAAGGSVDEVARATEKRCAATSAFFYVDTLEYLRRGGRIGAAAALLGSALAVKPLLHIVDGRIAPLDKVRTSARALARLAELAMERAGTAPVDMAVHHLASPARADQLATQLRESVPGLRELVRQRGGRGRRRARRPRHDRGGRRTLLTPAGLSTAGWCAARRSTGGASCARRDATSVRGWRGAVRPRPRTRSARPGAGAARHGARPAADTRRRPAAGGARRADAARPSRSHGARRCRGGGGAGRRVVRLAVPRAGRAVAPRGGASRTPQSGPDLRRPRPVQATSVQASSVAAVVRRARRRRRGAGAPSGPGQAVGRLARRGRPGRGRRRAARRGPVDAEPGQAARGRRAGAGRRSRSRRRRQRERCGCAGRGTARPQHRVRRPARRAAGCGTGAGPAHPRLADRPRPVHQRRRARARSVGSVPRSSGTSALTCACRGRPQQGGAGESSTASPVDGCAGPCRTQARAGAPTRPRRPDRRDRSRPAARRAGRRGVAGVAVGVGSRRVGGCHGPRRAARRRSHVRGPRVRAARGLACGRRPRCGSSCSARASGQPARCSPRGCGSAPSRTDRWCGWRTRGGGRGRAGRHLRPATRPQPGRRQHACSDRVRRPGRPRLAAHGRSGGAPAAARARDRRGVRVVGAAARSARRRHRRGWSRPTPPVETTWPSCCPHAGRRR